MDSTWEITVSSIKRQVPEHLFRMWIEPLKPGTGKNGYISLECPNPFSMKRVKEGYGSLIESEVQRIMGRKCVFVVNNSKQREEIQRKDIRREIQIPIPNVYDSLNAGCFLRKNFTFDSFVVGQSNQLAYSAALSLASKKHENHNSVLFLSKTGMGKSHLTQAAGNYIALRLPSERVYYITTEDFTREMVCSFRNKTIDEFKQKYRNCCDVLILEDIHHLSGKERTQKELIIILDSLYESNKKIFFSSCHLPVDIPKLDDALKSRLSCDLISTIEPPDFRTRVRILKKKAAINRYNIFEELIEYLAGELTENVRQLESGLQSVTRTSSLLGIPIDLKMCEGAVHNITKNNRKITIDVIKKLVCKEFKISVKDIVSRSRKRCFVRPRQIAIYLSHQYTDAPVQAIAKSFNRYHATAFHSINAVEKEMKTDSAVKGQVRYLSRKLDEGDF